MKIRLRQVCLATPTIGDAERLAEIFGVEIAHRDPLIIGFGLENALLGFGGTFVEFIAPLRDDTAATRFLTKHPGGAGYMVIHDTDAYDAVRRRVDEIGIRVAFEGTPESHAFAGDVPNHGYDTFRHVQLDPRSVGGTLVEFNQTDGGDDVFGPYAPAGERWWHVVRPDDDLPRIVGAECTSTDPEAMAATWAALMDRPVERDDDGPVIRLDGGSVDRFVSGSANAFTRVFVEATDPAPILERARSAGHEVTGSGFPFCGVDFVVVPRPDAVCAPA